MSKEKIKPNEKASLLIKIGCWIQGHIWSEWKNCPWWGSYKIKRCILCGKIERDLKTENEYYNGLDNGTGEKHEDKIHIPQRQG